MSRDPFVDAVRAVAMTGVVAGHWLVTAVVVVPGGLDVDSPLRHHPQLVPLSWLLQTLGLFFFAGGFGAAVSRGRSGESYGRWFGTRLRRLAVAVAVVLAAWAAVLGIGAAAGMPGDTVSTAAGLVTSPLWFLAVYLVLLAATGPLRRLHAACGVWAAAIPAALTVAAELGPDWAGQATVVLAWWVPWQLGVAAAEGWRPGRVAGFSLAACGAAVFAGLVLLAGFPASAVGGTGEPRSNLAPPSPAVVALALAQLGVVLLAAPALRGLPARAVGWINRRALPIFLLHQSALVAVTLLAAAVAVLPGLHTVPDTGAWVALRLAWLPVFAAVLWLLLGGLSRVLRST
ncbi:acyltransferase family protein [Amycolatopsis suaedae]|uniref:Acyltransferase n=1 Tax=Amycolatopsis suaedae TaxID=2510978 RepID=A0A4Q7JFK2_9PSEU|nr:acyltransferase family protein [Amycolatopsis suaedae]RZQ65663.1 acyltransferase [Amycolatopsis suaedae]